MSCESLTKFSLGFALVEVAVFLWLWLAYRNSHINGPVAAGLLCTSLASILALISGGVALWKAIDEKVPLPGKILAGTGMAIGAAWWIFSGLLTIYG